MATHCLFVYGTLRAGFDHPMAKLLALHAQWKGTGAINGRLYHLGRYPGVVQTSNPADLVQGDVYQLPLDHADLLRQLDDYETLESPLPAFFDRQLTKVTLGDGTTSQAWIYWYRGDVSSAQHIKGGDWLRIS